MWPAYAIQLDMPERIEPLLLISASALLAQPYPGAGAGFSLCRYQGTASAGPLTLAMRSALAAGGVKASKTFARRISARGASVLFHTLEIFLFASAYSKKQMRKG
jgi:hypothetical protein